MTKTEEMEKRRHPTFLNQKKTEEKRPNKINGQFRSFTLICS